MSYLRIRIILVTISVTWLLACGPSEIEPTPTTIASTVPGPPKQLIEIFSLTSCIPCSEADKFLRSLITDDRFDVVGLHHYGIPAVQTGEVHPSFTHDQYQPLFNRYGISFYPSAVVNRTDYSSKLPPKGETSYGLDRYSWG